MRLFAQAGESGLVLGVDAGTTAARSIATGSTVTTTGSTLAATATTTTTAALTGTTGLTVVTAATGTAAGRALRLDEAGVKVNRLLDLAFTLAKLLASAGSDELLLLGVESDSALPLLVDLAALVGTTGLELAKVELLLGLLGEIVGVRDRLVLRLGLLLSAVLGGLVALGDGLTGLLVLELGVALSGAPAGSGLLVSGAVRAESVS